MEHTVEFKSQVKISDKELHRVVVRALKGIFEDYTIKEGQLYKIHRGRGFDDSVEYELLPNDSISEYAFARINSRNAVLQNIKTALGI